MRTVISASRRTDIPAFYMRWFENRVREGYVDVRNPVVRERFYRVSLRPEDTHTIVLWSKNYRPFLDSDLSHSKEYRWYFNFSLVDCPEWEPGVPPLEDRLKQVEEICERWQPQQINWRFDPIVFWDGGKQNNLGTFERIADFMAGRGITRCTFSFVTWYNKVKKRIVERHMNFYDPPLQEKLAILEPLSRMAMEREIQMESCCDDALLKVEGIIRGSCVNGAILSETGGGAMFLGADTSQRRTCGCTKSADIGGYQMSCPHDASIVTRNPSFPKRVNR